MELNQLTHDADDLIRKVVSRYNQLYVPAGQISQIELDLMLDDMRKLYDTFKTIGQINLTLQNKSNKPEVSVNKVIHEKQPQQAASAMELDEKPLQTAKPTPPVIQPEQDIKPEVVPTAGQEDVINNTPDVESTLDSSIEPESVTDPEDVKTPTLESITQTEHEAEDRVSPHADTPKMNAGAIDKDPTHSMLADKFNTGNKSLSETIAPSQAQGVVGSRLLYQPISDLSTGIGLNDKFSFITDLFGNNAEKYEEAITRINKAVNFDEASWILQKYHAPDWDQHNETLGRLKDFVRRRFV